MDKVKEVEVAEQMLAMLNTMDVEITMAVLLDMMAMDSKIWSIKLTNNRIWNNFTMASILEIEL